MVRSLSFAIVTTVLLVSAASGADPDKKYVLQFLELDRGAVGSYTVAYRRDIIVQEINSQNITVSDYKYKREAKLAYWTRYENKGRVRRGYGEARATIDGKKEILPLEGKQVIIDWSDKGFTYKIDGVKEVDKKLENIVRHECAEEFTVSECLPARPVKLKESWRFDASHNAKWFQKQSKTLEYDVGKVQGLAQLLEVYEKDGRRFGKIVQHIELPVLSVTVKGKKKKLAETDKSVIQIHYDCCLDGSAHVGTAKVVDYLSTTTKGEGEAAKDTTKVIYKGERNVTFSEGLKK
jgi:hypothetical protein